MGERNFFRVEIQTRSETYNALKLLGERELGYGS